MEHNKKFKLVTSKKTRYLLPNILTLGGVCLGISSIKFAIDGTEFQKFILWVLNFFNTYKIQNTFPTRREIQLVLDICNN